MFGNSIYVSEISDDFILNKDSELYFTSFHIAEEFNDEFRHKALMLLRRIKFENKKVIVDLSPRGLKVLGYEKLRDFVLDYDVDYIRFDFGFTEEEMKDISDCCGIAVNASTSDLETVDRLGSNLIAIHNYYPRKETGLDWQFFRERNKAFRQRGIKVGAFIAGDEKKRGPLHEGLPTLEEHRFLAPYVQYCQLRKQADFIFTGDSGISAYQQELINGTENDGAVRLPVYFKSGFEYLYDQTFTNRPDSPFWMIRARESREYASQGPSVKAKSYSLPRNRGSITMDNEKYLRYSGEIQILREDFATDEKVNVIGNVAEGYIHLLECIGRGDKFRFVKDSKH